MGAWRYLEPKLRELLPTGAEMEYVGRPERASPAEGYPAAHAAEQSRIISEALGSGSEKAPLETVSAAGEGQGYGGTSETKLKGRPLRAALLLFSPSRR